MVAADVHALVEVLRHEHCFGRGHSVFIRRVLLQRGCGEGRGCVLLGYAALYLCYGKACRPDLCLSLVRLLLFDARAALFELAYRPERRILCICILKHGNKIPVLLGHERLNFALSVHNQTEGDGLHSARGEAVLYSVVEQG